MQNRGKVDSDQWWISSTVQLHGRYSHSSAETMLNTCWNYVGTNYWFGIHDHLTCWLLTQIWNPPLEPLLSPLTIHGLTFACKVGLPGVLKKDATAARQRALPWLGWYPLFCPEFTSVTSATRMPAVTVPFLGRCSTKFAGKVLHEKQRKPFQHWVAGEDSRLDRPVPKIPMSLMGFPAQDVPRPRQTQIWRKQFAFDLWTGWGPSESPKTIIKPGLVVQRATANQMHSIWYSIVFTCHVDDILKTKRLHWQQAAAF